MTRALALLLFVLTYAGIAVGSVPGLAIDRTGIALLGAVAMVAAGVVTRDAALSAIDAPTLLLLFGFMIISAQLRLSGFYTAVARRLGGLANRPRLFLAGVMGASAALSALLVNDIVCLAFTPVVLAVARGAALNPVPFLLGLAAASNIGSAVTLIGNPQNILIGQVGHLDFGGYLLWSLPPCLLALAAGYGLLLLSYRARWRAAAAADPADTPLIKAEEEPPLDAHEARKGLFYAAAAVALFFTPLPREVVALTAGAGLLCSRRIGTRQLLGGVDWHLVLLFCGLFIVIHGLETTGLPARALAWLAARGVTLTEPYAMLGVAAALSNLVSNVPATMLLTRFLDPANVAPWRVLAAASTLAGNLITVGSIANLIVIEGARRHGVAISFREHARYGAPLTLLSLALLALWLWAGG